MTPNDKTRVALAALTAAALAASGTARAQDAAGTPADGSAGVSTTSGRSTVYPAGYFTPFGPSNALDMVRRVPGFQVEESNNDVRGFSAAAGNVVINGARPSSKAESLQDLLRRIPTSQVLRIEVSPGDVYGSDYAGKSQVLNVVLAKGGGVTGNVKASAVRLWDDRVLPNLEGSVTLKRGTSSFSLSAGTGRFVQTEDGFDDVRTFPGDQRIEYRQKVNTITERSPFVAANWAQDGGANRSAHLNLRFAPSKFTLDQTNLVTPATGPVRDDRLGQEYRNTAYEIGGDLTRPLGGGAIKFVALANRRDRENADFYNNRLVGTETVIGGFEQTQDARYDEILGRLSWSHPKLLGFAAEVGNEVAYNKLDNATELYLLGPAGVRNRIDLPIDKATVTEWRTQSYVNLGRQLTPSLRLDTTLAYETSRLTVSGDTSAARSLQFFKPGVTLDWKGKGGWHVQASLRRDVAQLNFYDFISSAELASGRVSGGNAELVPQRTWQARLTADKPLLGRGQVKLELGYDRVTLLQDRVLTDDGFDAPGNIGDGTRKFAALTVDAPLDKFGLKATRLKLEGTVQQTSVRDPLSGRDRRFSGFWPNWRWQAELRRDLAKWSYGFSLFDRDRFSFFYIDETDTNFNDKVYAVAFAEYRPDKRTTVRLDVENALNTHGQRERRFFDPNRTVALPVAVELRDRNSHPSFQLSINRTFGG